MLALRFGYATQGNLGLEQKKLWILLQSHTVI